MPVEVAVAIVAGVFAIIGPITVMTFKHWLARRARLHSKQMHEDVVLSMRRVRAVYEQLNRMIMPMEKGGTSARRVLLLAGHNAGGIPRPGSGFWVSGLYWDADTTARRNVLADYQNIPVDAGVISTLLAAEEKEYVCSSTSEMRDSQMKRFYEAEGVTHTIIWFIAIVENKFIFVSVGKYEDEPFTPDEITRMRLRIYKIQRAMETARPEHPTEDLEASKETSSP